MPVVPRLSQSAMIMPSPPLPEMTFPSPAPAPPTCVNDAPDSIWRPRSSFWIGAVPASIGTEKVALDHGVVRTAVAKVDAVFSVAGDHVAGTGTADDRGVCASKMLMP